jgi:hypothetical protein
LISIFSESKFNLADVIKIKNLFCSLINSTSYDVITIRINTYFCLVLVVTYTHDTLLLRILLFFVLAVLWLWSICSIQDVFQLMNAVIDGNSGETTSLSALDPSLSHMRTPADARRIAYVVYSHPVEHDIPSFTNFIFPSMDSWIQDVY